MTAIRRLTTNASDFDERLRELLAFESAQDPDVERAVAEIIAAVKARGDAALLDYTRRLDRVEATTVVALEVGAAEARAALARIPASMRRALEAAAARVRTYHEKQRADSWSYRDADGTELGQRITALDRVGIYVPGGKAAYPSSVIMNALPARVAGVAEVIMVVPTPGGPSAHLEVDDAAIAGIAGLVDAAERPVLMVGSDVYWEGAETPLVELAESARLPVLMKIGRAHV